MFGKKMPPAAMAGKKKTIGSPDDEDQPGMPDSPETPDESPDEQEQDAHEAEESPAYEQTEEAGAGMLQNVVSLGESYGLKPEESRQFAAMVLQNAADMLMGGATDEGGGGEEMRG